MNILISGASGFVGSALYTRLKREGHHVKVLSRKGWDEAGSSIQWDPSTGKIDTSALEGLDVVVHLAGESIASGRWTSEKKQRLLESRVQGTALLANSVSTLKLPPKVFISASAIGYYGNRGQEVLHESSAPTNEFLSTVCQQWEKAALTVKSHGVRLVTLRFGIVLGRGGGALAQMLVPFQLGLGGKFGNGKQFMSWISLDDILGIIDFSMKTPSVEGVYNAVAPHPVTNAQFTESMGRALCRPTLFSVPAFGARLLMGEMADALLLASARVDASKVIKAGYQFQHPDINAALESILKPN